MNLLYTILAAAPPDAAKENPMGSMWIFFILMFVMMYFLIIRPQSKQRKEQAARVASMEKGDHVVTIGGLHGSVHSISTKKNTVTIKLSEGVFVPFEKDAIRVVNKIGGGKKKEEAPAEEEEENEPAENK